MARDGTGRDGRQGGGFVLSSLSDIHCSPPPPRRLLVFLFQPVGEGGPLAAAEMNRTERTHPLCVVVRDYQFTTNSFSRQNLSYCWS
jgi:hypothetical protein